VSDKGGKKGKQKRNVVAGFSVLSGESEKHVNAQGGYYEGPISEPSSNFYIQEPVWQTLEPASSSTSSWTIIVRGFHAKVSCGQGKPGKRGEIPSWNGISNKDPDPGEGRMLMN